MYTATDEDGDPVSLTFALLIGPQPVIISGAGAINENTDTASGSLTITNRNIGGSILIDALDADGDYGSISIDTAGGWTYTLDNDNTEVNLLTTGGGTLMDTFTVTATAPPLVTHDLVITINGFNDAPVAEITVPASAIQVSHGAVRDVTGTATDVDDDNSGLTLAWSAVLAGTTTAAGSFVNADMATATWTAPAMDATVTLTFSASDGATTTESTVTVTVTPVDISFTGTSPTSPAPLSKPPTAPPAAPPSAAPNNRHQRRRPHQPRDHAANHHPHLRHLHHRRRRHLDLHPGQRRHRHRRPARQRPGRHRDGDLHRQHR